VILHSFAYQSHKTIFHVAIVPASSTGHTSSLAAPLSRPLILSASSTDSHIVTCCTRRRSWSRCSLCINDPLFDLASQLEERLFHANVALRTDFHERNAELICKSLTLRSADLALLLPVAFVTDQDLVDAFGCVLLDVGEPGAYICDRLISMLDFTSMRLRACCGGHILKSVRSLVIDGTGEVDYGAATSLRLQLHPTSQLQKHAKKHKRTNSLLKLLSSVTSYTSNMPIAPL